MSESNQASASRTSYEKATPFQSGGRTRDGEEWVGPPILPELYTPAERSNRKHSLKYAEQLAEWQVEKKLSKLAMQVWDGKLMSHGIEAPEAPLTLQQVNEYAEKLSTATVNAINAAAAAANRRW